MRQSSSACSQVIFYKLFKRENSDFMFEKNRETNTKMKKTFNGGNLIMRSPVLEQ
jgi:hypothetical protein